MRWRGPALLLACMTAVVLPALAGAGVAGASSGGASSGGASSTAASSAAAPTVELSTRVVAPGATVVVTGQGWAPGTALAAVLCGADDVAGTADCAYGGAVDLAATSRGLLWGKMVAALPPAPCPCVVAVSGVSTGYVEKIPVTVLGASTAPVASVPHRVAAPLRLDDLRVTARSTLASDLGGPAPRTLSVRLTNVAPYPVTPVVVGRWGPGTSPRHVIVMPVLDALAGGHSETVRVPFSLSAFAVGSYSVRVTAEVAGVPRDPSLSAVTAEWPYLLFACGLVIVLLVGLVVAVAIARRRGAS